MLILHEREREKKFSEMALLIAVSGVSDSLRSKLLDAYHEELFEDAYRPAVIKRRRDEARKKINEQINQIELLNKLNTFSSTKPPDERR